MRWVALFHTTEAIIYLLLYNLHDRTFKFNFIFFSNIHSYYQKADLNVLFQSLFFFQTFLTKFSLKTLAFTVLFRCNFS